MAAQENTTLHQSLTGVEVQGYIFVDKDRQQEWKDIQITLGQAVNKLKLKVPDDLRARPVIYADFTQGELKIWVSQYGAALDQNVKAKLYTATECIRAEIWMRNESSGMHECRVWHAGILSVRERLGRHGL